MKIFALPLLLLLFAAPSAFAMRCGNSLITQGMRDFQVRQRCGEPFWTDGYTNVDIVGARGPLERQRTVQYDVWYYNFGPRRFMRRLLFRDGELLNVETLGYGVDQIGANCNPRRDYRGFTSGELYANCGEPISRRIENDTLVRRPAPGVERWHDLRREEWIYDAGDARSVRVLRLVGGRVESIDTLPR
jgi:hypothetical protein